MIRMIFVALVTSGLMACGPSFTGTVSGYPVNVPQALFVTQADSNGSVIGAVALLSDQPELCSQLPGPKAPSDASIVMLGFARKVDGNALSPDVGKYTVGATGDTVSGAFGFFLRSDANGVSSIPQSNASTSSGLLDVTSFSVAQREMAATFDGKFGQQEDVVQGAFSAQLCDISAESLANGFIGRLAGLSYSATLQQSAACRDYVACSYKVGVTAGSLDSSYGSGGTCWESSATADSCTSACTSGNQVLQSDGYASEFGCAFGG